MASKKKIPADGPSDSGGDSTPPPATPPVDLITKLELFFERHWRPVVGALVILVTIVVVYFWIKYKKEDTMTASNQAFTSAVTRSDFEQVVKDHPGTVAAGSALYAIADRQLAEPGETGLKGAQATLEKFLADFPDHNLRENALMGLGGIAERLGDMDKANGYFQQVIDAGDKTSLGPLAAIYQTELLVAKGELEKAKEAYEAFGVNYVGSPFVDKAAERLEALERRIARKAAPTAPAEPEPVKEPAPEKEGAAEGGQKAETETEQATPPVKPEGEGATPTETENNEAEGAAPTETESNEAEGATPTETDNTEGAATSPVEKVGEAPAPVEETEPAPTDPAPDGDEPVEPAGDGE